MDIIATEFSQTPVKSLNHQEPRQIVEDLFEPRADIFWLDLLISATLGWGAFVVACLVQPLSWKMFVAVVVAAIALYRALIFIHELTHLRLGTLPGFAQVWNLTVGFPLLLPSFVYVGVHADHHRLATYGTVLDPEYLPFAGKKLEILLFVAHSLLIPAILLLRFLVLAPLGLLLPPFHRFLERHASSLSMNLAYCRQVSAQKRIYIKITELLILGLWAIPILLTWQGIFHWHIVIIWYGVVGCITFTNTLRTLGAHRYSNSENSMGKDAQLLDSINTPGTWWTTIWAPVGLRYHALHHNFPTMPYHNLPIAHQRLVKTLPASSPYLLATSPSLWHSLQRLWENN